MSYDLHHQRGLWQSRHPRAEEARQGFQSRIARLKAEGLGSGATVDFLAAQMAFHRRHAPEQMAELDGIAEGFSVDLADIWLHLHAGTLSDIQKGAGVLDDGCSAFASGVGPDSPYLIKNRDLGGPIELVQIARRVESATGGILALGSLFAPLAYSSGMNGRGLALADTHVAVNQHRVGWLRYLLMGHLLDTCHDLTSALGVLRSQPHCGGGTIEMVDRSGAAAAVELPATGPEIETGGAAHWRSNHYLRPKAAPQNLSYADPNHQSNSAWRLTLLDRLGADPKVRRADVMDAFSEAETKDGTEGLCQKKLAKTISCAIYSPALGALDWTDGAPCETPWQRLTI